jgi:hypothetical protein
MPVLKEVSMMCSVLNVRGQGEWVPAFDTERHQPSPIFICIFRLITICATITLNCPHLLITTHLSACVHMHFLTLAFGAMEIMHHQSNSIVLQN